MIILIMQPEDFNMATLRRELVDRLKGKQAETDVSAINTKVDLIRALNNYHNSYEKKDAMTWLVAYLKKNGYKEYHDAVKSGNFQYNKAVSTLGFCCRLVTLGIDENVLSKDDIHQKLLSIKITPKSEDEKPAKQPSKKINQILVSIDAGMDAITDNNKPEPVLLSGTKAEIDEALKFCSSEIKNMKEWDEYHDKPYVKSLTAFFKGILEQAQKMAVSVARKPRAKKAKPASKIISKLRYAKSFDELKLKSFNPENLIGAKEAVLYNSKTRQVIVLKSTQGFSVTGTTITNIDDESYWLRLRKPELVFINGSPAHKSLLSKLKAVKSSQYKASGRTNADILLLTFLR